MSTRVATLDYRVVGEGRATVQVRTLSQALEVQKRNAHALQPAFAAASRGSGMMGAVSQASTGQVMALAGAMGPLGAGLGFIAARAPMAATGLMGYAAAATRATLLSRAANAAILGGAAVMATGAAVSVGYAGAILRGADAYAAMTSRLKIFSDTSVAAAQNERALYETARDARTSVEGLSTLFVRISPAVEDMGRAQAAALEVTESVSKALAVQGATTNEATSATVQLSQALASGVMRGDEFRSLMESAPLLMRYIAQNLTLDGKEGVAFGQLRALAEEGELTSERVLEALLKAQEAIERDFANAPKTAAQGWVVLRDQVTRTVGEMSKTTGLQQGVFEFLGGLADRLDAFRTQAALDPDMFDPVIEAGKLFGDVLDTAGQLAGGVAENFDLITDAAQALIALKVGEVLAIGFGAAAAKAREAYGAVQAWRASGWFNAGMANDKVGGQAAIAARTAAVAAATRADDLQAQAQIKVRNATSARAAADAAAAEATRLKATAGVQATVVAEAEARSSALNTAAEKAETQAKNATTGATNAQAVASARLAIAQEAEAAVTRDVSARQAVKHAVGRGLLALYGLMGGAIGIVTLALGGLIYALWQNEQAWQEKIRSLREAAVASDDMEAISRSLASATWAEIPALLASADARYKEAAAARELAASLRQEAEARAAALNKPGTALLGFMQGGATGLGAVLGGRRAAERDAVALGSIERAAAADEFRQREARYQAQMNAMASEARWRAEENRTGKDAAGRAIGDDRRAENAARLAEINAAGTRAVEALDRRLTAQETAAASATGDQQKALQNGVTIYRRSWEAAASAATAGQANEAVAPPSRTTGGGKGRKAGASEDRAIASQLERISDAALIDELMGRTAGAGGRFSERDGTLFDGETAFKARSEDEARAAAAYLEQIEAIRTAKDGLIADTGMTREALAAQAEQTLATALATSQGAQAEERWRDRMAEARGESLATVQAEREVAEARKQGATVTDEQARAYIALIAARERARKAEEALNAARPVVSEVTRETLDGMGQLPEAWRPDRGEMGFDIEAALKQWAEARERILTESERRIRERTEKEVRDGLKTREQADAEIAAAKVAVEAESAQQVKDLWNRLREDDQRAWRDRLEERLEQERQLADSITGALEDLAFNADAGDIGRQFADDLMRAIWQELVTNPLNQTIRTLLRDLTGGSGPANGGLWGAIGRGIGGLLGGGSPAAAATAGGFGGDGGGLLPGMLMRGFAGGGLPALATGMIRGPGGPRDDKMAALVSPWEYIVNARATRDNLPLLEAMNAGHIRGLKDLPGFAGGGLPGGSPMSPLLIRDALLDAEASRSVISAERDRVMADGGQAPATLQVNVINQTSKEVEPEVRRTPTGFEVVLREAARAEVQKMGADGSLARAGRMTPGLRGR